MRLGHLLAAGGWLMAPIYACSVAALAVFLRKLVAWRRLRVRELGWLAPLLAELERGDLAGARDRLDRAAHPAARAAAAAVAVMERRPDRARAEAARAGSLELQRFEATLGLLSFIAQAAPLLGLLGTVVGLVGVFLDIESGAGVLRDSGVDVSQLSSGIWTALLTTAAGLVVAVPALAGYSYLSACADRLRLLIHDTIEQVLTAAPMTAAVAPPAADMAEAGPAPGADAEP